MTARDPHLRHLGRPLVPGCPDCDRQLAQLSSCRPTLSARMSPERFEELSRRITSDLWAGDRTHRELLDALTAERAYAQQVEVPLSAARGFALHVQSLGDSFVILDGAAGAELFPSAQAAIDEVPLYEEHGETVTPVALVPVTAWPGADRRIG